MKSASVFALSCHRMTTFQSWSAHPRVQIEGFWASQAFCGHCVGSVSNAVTDGGKKFIPADSGQRVLLRVQQHIDEHAVLRCQLICGQVRSDVKATWEACQFPGVRVWHAHEDENSGIAPWYGDGRTFGGHSASRLMSNLSHNDQTVWRQSAWAVARRRRRAWVLLECVTGQIHLAGTSPDQARVPFQSAWRAAAVEGTCRLQRGGFIVIT
jgi:hypothetical protein